MNKEKLSVFSDQACAVSLYILLFFIPISSALTESFFAFAFLFFLGRLCTTQGLFIQILKRERIVLFFFAALALSLINSGPYIGISLHALFLKWGKYIVLYLITGQTVNSAPRIKNALVSVSYGLGTVILDCLYQLYFHVDLLGHKHMMAHAHNVFALSGPFNHNNGLAAYLSCMLIVILFWVFSKEKKMIKIIVSIVFFLGVFVLAHAYSRGGWFAFVWAIILLACFLKKFWFLGFSMLITSALSLKFILFKNLVDQDSGRFELWNICLKMIKQHPLLGNGIGTFMAQFKEYCSTRGISYAHNCFLQLWAEAGLIGIALFVFFIFITLKGAILNYKARQNHILLILFCAIVSYLSSSFFDTSLFSSQLAFLFWALMGLTVAVGSIP